MSQSPQKERDFYFINENKYQCGNGLMLAVVQANNKLQATAACHEDLDNLAMSSSCPMFGKGIIRQQWST
jgi:hypothetical protein